MFISVFDKYYSLAFYLKTKNAFADVFLINLLERKEKEMATLGQERSKRHSAGYGEDRSDLYGSYDSYGSYGYSSGGGGGGYGGCGCCHQKQDSLLLPLILAGIAAAAGYLFGRNNNNNGRNFGPQPTITARSAQVILDGKWSGGMEV